MSNFEYDLSSRYICIEIEIKGKKLTLLNIYAPNFELEKLVFLNNIYYVIISKKNIIMAGDFNAVTSTNDRKTKSGIDKKLNNYEKEWLTLYK